MPKLSAAARKKISESMRKAWAARRAKQRAGGGTAARTPSMAKSAVSGNHAHQAIAGAVSAIKRLTLGDIQGFAHRNGSVDQVTELVRLATELKGFLTPTAKTR